ncbi:Histone deacetylase 4 [Aphelenchoides besseyi]|nr:Histone deacetylase 4 [Aphelenchoides besseyi]
MTDRPTGSSESNEDEGGFERNLAILQEMYQRKNADLLSQLQQCSQFSAQDYLQTLQLFGNLPLNRAESSSSSALNQPVGSAPSSGFNFRPLTGQKSVDVEMASMIDIGANRDANQQPSSSNLTPRNRRTFSGSGQTISQHTRDRLKTMIATKKQKQRLHSAGSIGSQNSLTTSSNSPTTNWLQNPPAVKSGSDANLIAPLVSAQLSTLPPQSAGPSSVSAAMTPNFDISSFQLPTSASINQNAAPQLSEFQLRKVNSEPNLKMRLRARLLNKGSSPVTHSTHPYNNLPASHGAHHRPLQRCESDSAPLEMLLGNQLTDNRSTLPHAQSSSLLQMPTNMVIPSPSLPNLSNGMEQLQLDWSNLLMQTPFASFLSMPSLLRNALLPQSSSIMEPQLETAGGNRFESNRGNTNQLPIGGYPSLLKQQLRDLVLRRKSLVREEPEEEQMLEAFSQRFQNLSNAQNNQLKTGLAYDAMMSKHQCLCGENQNHVEHGGRVHSIWARLQERGFVDSCERSAMRKASLDLLRLVHTPTYVTFFAVSPTACLKLEASEMPLKSFVQLSCGGIGVDSDTYFNDANTQLAIRMAVGSLVELASQVIEGKMKNGFACIRPPGHHAEREQAMGFCFFNNVAIAARYLQKTYPNQCKRIAIVDWDVHHGNGTQLCFEADPSVLYISMHRHDNGNFFPGTGAVTEMGVAEGRGFTVNIPFSGDTMGDAEYLAAWRVLVLPLLDAFCPDFILVSSGFDAAKGHALALGGYEVSPKLFGYFTRTLLSYADGKVVLALEGGYDLPSICDSAEACVRALCDNGGELTSLSKESLEKIPNQAAQDTIQKVIAVHKKTWPVLTGIQGINTNEMYWQTSQRFPSLTV